MAGKESPCIGVCKYVGIMNGCKVCACGRFEHEITNWGAYPEKQKENIRRYAAVRKEVLDLERMKNTAGG